MVGSPSFGDQDDKEHAMLREAPDQLIGQPSEPITGLAGIADDLLVFRNKLDCVLDLMLGRLAPVSYTHLTLPTNREV